jgi:hypothetical protein
VQGFVERRVDDPELTVRAVVNPLAEGEAVHRLSGERPENGEIHGTANEVVAVWCHAPSTEWRERWDAGSPASSEGRDE